MSAHDKQFQQRRARVRRALRKVASDRPRLSVYRSSKHIYAQLIDDKQGKTIASASSIDKELKASLPKGVTAFISLV